MAGTPSPPRPMIGKKTGELIRWPLATAAQRRSQPRGAPTPGCGRDNCSFGGDPEIFSCHAATTRRHRLSEVVCALESGRPSGTCVDEAASLRDSARASPLAKSARQHVATWSQAAALRRGRRAAGLWACDRESGTRVRVQSFLNYSIYRSNIQGGARPSLRATSSLTRLTPANALY